MDFNRTLLKSRVCVSKSPTTLPPLPSIPSSWIDFSVMVLVLHRDEDLLLDVEEVMHSKKEREREKKPQAAVYDR